MLRDVEKQKILLHEKIALRYDNHSLTISIVRQQINVTLYCNIPLFVTKDMEKRGLSYDQRNGKIHLKQISENCEKLIGHRLDYTLKRKQHLAFVF